MLEVCESRGVRREYVRVCFVCFKDGDRERYVVGVFSVERQTCQPSAINDD